MPNCEFVQSAFNSINVQFLQSTQNRENASYVCDLILRKSVVQSIFRLMESKVFFFSLCLSFCLAFFLAPCMPMGPHLWTGICIIHLCTNAKRLGILDHGMLVSYPLRGDKTTLGWFYLTTHYTTKRSKSVKKGPEHNTNPSNQGRSSDFVLRPLIVPE